MRGGSRAAFHSLESESESGEGLGAGAGFARRAVGQARANYYEWR